MLYEFVTLEVRNWDAASTLSSIAAYSASAEAKGSLLGCWQVDIGTIGRLYLLRSFRSEHDRAEERRKLLLSSAPFAIAQGLSGFSIESYEPFPFVPPVEPGRYGNVYEFREYFQTVGGIARSIDAWREALPARQAISPVLTVMHALDGPPRILHIVAYESLDARSALRAEIYRKGIWPPKGAPEQIVKGISTIAIPTDISSLR
jgi:hypothetical protein